MKKRLIIITGGIVLAAGLYFAAYKSASITESASGEWTLHVLGIPMDYDETSGQVFYTLFKPFLLSSAEAMPTEPIRGTIEQIDTAKKLLLVKEGSGGNVSFTMDESGIDANLVPGALVVVTYKLQPVPTNPFTYFYQLKQIAKQ